MIDDFGVAISSFGSLKRLPRLNAIKIDASFIAGLGRSPEDSAGVAAIIGLAHGLKLTATAEGVERDEQLRELQALHCDRGQGYYFARPAAPGGARRGAQVRAAWRADLVGPSTRSRYWFRKVPSGSSRARAARKSSQRG